VIVGPMSLHNGQRTPETFPISNSYRKLLLVIRKVIVSNQVIKAVVNLSTNNGQRTGILIIKSGVNSRGSVKKSLIL